MAIDNCWAEVGSYSGIFQLCSDLFSAYEGNGDYDGSIKAFQTVVDKSPKEIYPWLFLAEAFRVKGDCDGSIEALGTAIDEIGMDPGISLAIFRAYKDKDDYEGAIKAFELAVNKHPDDVHLWRLLG